MLVGALTYARHHFVDPVNQYRVVMHRVTLAPVDVRVPLMPF